MVITQKTIGLYITVIIFVNSALWAAAIHQGFSHPLLLSLYFIAYLLGLKHAFDVDHIIAIDNITRQFVAQKHPSKRVGLCFSLGHSTIVLLLSLGIICAGKAFQESIKSFVHSGAHWGLAVAAVLLLLFGAINTYFFINCFKQIKYIRQGNCPMSQKDVKVQGFLSTILSPLLKIVRRERHVFVIGCLFGLGFDTTTEVALLGLTACQIATYTLTAVILLPLLFMVGMTSLDTIIGLLIRKMIVWSHHNQMTKLLYNAVITFITAAIAFSIGLYELFLII